MKLTSIAAAALLLSAMPAMAETLVIAVPTTPKGFDADALKPGTIWVVTQTYESLANYARVTGPDGITRADVNQIVPWLAESWSVSDDQKTWDVKLRQGVKSFHGNELTADDVVWSWEKSFHQRRTGKFVLDLANFEGIEAVDDYTVRFRLKAPTEMFLHLLTAYLPSIYDSEITRQHVTDDDPWALKWIDANTAGFGPYHLDTVVQGQQAVFVANPNYFGEKPYYDRVIMREVPSAASRLQLLQAGQAHLVQFLTPQQARDVAVTPNVRVFDNGQGTAVADVKMNVNYEPFGDIRVRQAVQLATDYDAINRVVFLNETGVRPTAIIPPAIPGHNPDIELVPHDPERAKQLLAEAGFPDGIDVTLEYSGLNWWEEGVALQMQQSLAAAGIRVTAKRIPDTEMSARIAIGRRDLPFFTVRDLSAIFDPVYKLYLEAHNAGPSARNDYNNPKVNELVEAAMVEGDAEKRTAYVQEVQQIFADDATTVGVAFEHHLDAMAACITGVVSHPDYAMLWREMRCEQ